MGTNDDLLPDEPYTITEVSAQGVRESEKAVAVPESVFYAIFDELKAAYRPKIEYDHDPAENSRRALAVAQGHVYRAMERLKMAAKGLLDHENI